MNFLTDIDLKQENEVEFLQKVWSLDKEYRKLANIKEDEYYWVLNLEQAINNLKTANAI